MQCVQSCPCNAVSVCNVCTPEACGSSPRYRNNCILSVANSLGPDVAFCPSVRHWLVPFPRLLDVRAKAEYRTFICVNFIDSCLEKLTVILQSNKSPHFMDPEGPKGPPVSLILSRINRRPFLRDFFNIVFNISSYDLFVLGLWTNICRHLLIPLRATCTDNLIYRSLITLITLVEKHSLWCVSLYTIVSPVLLLSVHSTVFCIFPVSLNV
jgi:hypothetical protein